MFVTVSGEPYLNIRTFINGFGTSALVLGRKIKAEPAEEVAAVEAK